jgi:preprotein translocase subunit YajC
MMHLNYLNAILADAAATPPAAAPAAPGGATGPQPTPVQQLLGSPLTLVVLMIVMMYFLIFRPQSQQRKRQMQLLETMKSGDKVVTSSGIVGVIVTVKDKTISLRSADAKMEVTKSSVTEILERGEAASS